MIKKQGFVALLDVLGFAERVSAEGTRGLDKYIDTVVELAQFYFGIDTVLFSDTVVLYALDDSLKTYDEIVELTSSLSYHLLMAEVPTRGGDCLWSIRTVGTREPRSRGRGAPDR